jgi:hypothetical protein
MRPMMGLKCAMILEIGCHLQAAENVICLAELGQLITIGHHMCPESFVEYFAGVES